MIPAKITGSSPIKKAKRGVPLMLLILVLFIAVLPNRSVAVSDIPIDHIIVLYEENRTFDNYFGTYPGANGITGNESLPVNPGSNVTASSFHLSNTSTKDLNHTHPAAVTAYDNGKMDGFVYAEESNMTMGYYDYRDIPYYWDYASRFVLMDNFFSSEMGPSLPNHLYLIAGQSDNIYNNLPAGDLSNLTLNFPVIMDELDSSGISWKYYTGTGGGSSSPDEPGFWNPLPAFESFKTNQSRLNNVVNNSQFLSDLTDGQLASVSWVIPNAQESEHPGQGDIVVGEQYIVNLVNAIMQSQYWNSTAIFITWDDYGGWYDHVPPPQLDSFGLGFRIPCLVISPYAKQGFMDNTQSDFCSILKFIETRYSLLPLTQRDTITDNMLEAFNFSQTPREPLILPGLYVPDHYPLVLNTPDITVTAVVPEKRVIEQGFSMQINVTVENIGNSNESFNLTAYVNTAPIGTKHLTLPGGNSTTTAFAWNTTGFAYGNYTISAYAETVPGENDTANNTYTDGTVQIIPTIPEFPLILLLFMMIPLVTAVLKGRKRGFGCQSSDVLYDCPKSTASG